MANNYYDPSAVDVPLGVTARSEHIDNVSLAVEAAFDGVPTEDQLKYISPFTATETSSSTTAYTVTRSNTVTEYVDGLTVVFKTSNTNTDAATLNVDSVAIKAIRRLDDTPAVAGDITGWVRVKYDTAANSGAGAFMLVSVTPAMVTAAEAAQTYSEEWATKAEDSLISTDAGGDGATDYSSLHHAAKAAASASAASSSASSASSDAASTAADVLSTNADVVSTNADVVSTAADAASTAADAASTAADVLSTAADVVSTNADAASTAADVLLTNADVVSTNADAASTAADVISTNADAASTAADVATFATQYISSASEPGSPTEGLLWYDETNDIMKVYNGSSWQLAGSSVNGTAERQEYTATGGQTTFAATYDIGFVDVYRNGFKLPTSDFTATNGTSIVLGVGATAGDIIAIIAYGTFEIADTYTQTQADALLDLKANIASPTFTGTVVVPTPTNTTEAMNLEMAHSTALYF